LHSIDPKKSNFSDASRRNPEIRRQIIGMGRISAAPGGLQLTEFIQTSAREICANCTAGRA